MIVEQIRYFVDENQRERLVRLRREVTRLRRDAGVPGGTILLADDAAEGGPAVIWQCGYEDETELGAAEAALIGNPEYEQARNELTTLVQRVELELYLSDEDNQPGGTNSV